MQLTEAVARFRALDEARVPEKGRSGYRGGPDGSVGYWLDVFDEHPVRTWQQKAAHSLATSVPVQSGRFDRRLLRLVAKGDDIAITKALEDPRRNDDMAIVLNAVEASRTSRGGWNEDLDEAVKVGDYVTAKDGRTGYVLSVDGDMVAFERQDTDDVAVTDYASSRNLTVNPGGSPH